MNILIDGVGYQLAKMGIGPIWTSILSRPAMRDGLNILMLDRGGAPDIPGVELIKFPTYTMTYTATDSLLIQEFCDKLNIDVFTSTYYTSATKTPQVQVVYDMIPEALGLESSRDSKEKRIALSYSHYFACFLANTRADLLSLYPSIEPSHIVVTPCGVDATVFNAEAFRNNASFRDRHDVSRPYFLFVGSGERNGDYKNAKLFFDAIKVDKSADFDVVCVGGEPEVSPRWQHGLPPGINVMRLALSDAELAAAYSDAIALVYLSLHESFGMPVLEAMACGCPVITTDHAYLREVAADAAVVVSGHDTYELLRALNHVREPSVRRRHVGAGLAHARQFGWDKSAELFRELLLLASCDHYNREVMEFHRRWHQLRVAQSNVDVGLG